MTIPGFTGKVLRVDLTASKVSVEEIKWDWAEKFIGGRGLAARYAWDEIKAGVEPLSPENVLMVWTGPVEGTMVPLNGRYLFATKSPATGTYLDCYVGGHLGPELKYAGFDGIIIKGRASKPVYLYIKDGKAELKDGSKLWGKNTIDVQKMIRDENNDQKIRIASVGPAGENMSKMACICSDIYRQAARGGVGAVMGSKNLKAIAVRGTMGLAVSNISKIVEVCKESYKVDGLNNPDNEGMITDGTPMIVTMSQDSGILPTRNFQDGMFDDVSKIDTETLKANHTIRRRACFGCVLACASWTKGRGRFESAKVEGPEYETIALCGSNCGVGDLSAIIKFNMECDMYGIDTMSAGDTIAFAMELYEKGIITKNETDGIDLKFGNIDAYVAMPQILALRKGNLGKLFADGTAPAVKAIGKDSYKYAMHVKGMELPAYDPRGTIGMALTYATSERGADHLRAWPAAVEAYGSTDPFITEGKAELVSEDQRRTAAKWSIMFCDFLSIGYEPMAKLYNVVTGKNVDEAYLRHVGDRIWNLVRAFNVREGFTNKEDVQPFRIENEPLPRGKTEGHKVSKEDFEKILKEYYKLWNWDDQGRPTKAALHAVELDDIAAQLPYLN